MSKSSKIVSVALQEVPTEDPIPLGKKGAAIRPLSKSKAAITLAEDGGWLKAPVDLDCVGFSLDYGVLDRREQKRGVYKLFYYAKSATSINASQTEVGLPLDMSVSRNEKGQLVALVLENGKPLAKASVTVGLGGDNLFLGVTDEDGRAVLPDLKGAIAVLASTSRNESGEGDGLTYETVRSHITLHIPAVPEESGPLTQVLRQSFGDSHDVVGQTEFIETLMSGKLTKAQVESHFQQRALVHEAVDRILSSSKEASLPYGSDQMQVIRFLRSDLEKMGSSWPTMAIATPLTKAFIAEIEESAKKGPYFALGVLHVYYGGITHGGRDIGAKIVETVKVDTAYYLKCGGYAAYAAKVNKIVGEYAQQQMIAGGKAAYKYIIASSDEPIYRSQPF